ncbi:hypothetical protein B0H66DRAFT_73567 [Apodospora peruviana]|uniref:GATA-type domain-containing protein n=1 Tax=Apodospora peruviana TaxID=516989 RepID=A0AAE0ITJ7_9PEZI|nr:hypothetical protein B0H66DRAFT_73567 [Apodospora peruviana]
MDANSFSSTRTGGSSSSPSRRRQRRDNGDMISMQDVTVDIFGLPPITIIGPESREERRSADEVQMETKSRPPTRWSSSESTEGTSLEMSLDHHLAQQHDPQVFDVERGFWRVYQGARELLKYAQIYQESRQDELEGRATSTGALPREIDVVSMTQLSWGVLRAVGDINAYDRRSMIRQAAAKASLQQRKENRKVMKRGRRRQQQGSTSSLKVNVCKTCGTIDSPRWRYGPEGLLSLCNVCGLLYAKKTERRGGLGMGLEQDHGVIAS